MLPGMSATQGSAIADIDLTIRGRLPPSNGRKVSGRVCQSVPIAIEIDFAVIVQRATNEARVWKKPETFKYTYVLNVCMCVSSKLHYSHNSTSSTNASGNIRPGSVPAKSLVWDDNVSG